MIKLIDVCKIYKTKDIETNALKNVNIEFDNKGFTFILGPSGSGKTTLLNIIGGLDKASSGDILIDDISIKDYSSKKFDEYRNTSVGFKYLFKCIEKSNWCTRRFCPSTQRPLDLDIIHCSSYDQLGMNYTTPFATMNKPFLCTICCICRPEIEVILNSSGKAIGKVRHVCTVCDPTFEVYNAEGNLRYAVSANCCQCALLMPGFLSKSSRGVFDILEGEQKVGSITKEPASLSELVTDADSYIVNFPTSADANDKLLLTGLALLIDYQFFESDADEDIKKRRKGGGGVSLKIGGVGLKISAGGRRRK